jgi:hypothetical protein
MGREKCRASVGVRAPREVLGFTRQRAQLDHPVRAPVKERGEELLGTHAGGRRTDAHAALRTCWRNHSAAVLTSVIAR